MHVCVSISTTMSDAEWESPPKLVKSGWSKCCFQPKRRCFTFFISLITPVIGCSIVSIKLRTTFPSVFSPVQLYVRAGQRDLCLHEIWKPTAIPLSRSVVFNRGTQIGRKGSSLCSLSSIVSSSSQGLCPLASHCPRSLSRCLVWIHRVMVIRTSSLDHLMASPSWPYLASQNSLISWPKLFFFF